MSLGSTSAQGQLKSNYLDKLFTTYTDCLKRTGFQITFTAVLSIVLLLLSVNYLNVSQGWTMAGLTFSVPQPALLIGGSLFLMWRHLLVVSLSLQQRMAGSAIWRLYRELGFEDPTLTEQLPLFDRPDGIALFVPFHLFYESYGTQLILLITVVVQMIAAWLLPIVAQVLVAYRLLAIFGLRWWILSAYAILGLLLGLYYAQVLRLLLSDQDTEKALPTLPLSGPNPPADGARTPK